MSENELHEKYNKPPIWSPNAILLVGVIFSFIIGGIMNVISYKRLGYIHKAKKRLIFLILATIGIFLLATFINMNSISLAINLVFVFFYRNDQKGLFENHIKQGGKKASVLIPVLLSTLCAIILLGGLYWSENSIDESYSSYIYENHPDLYDAIIKNDKFKGKFNLFYEQHFDASYGENRSYYVYDIEAEGSLNGQNLRIISSYDNRSKEYFRGVWERGEYWQNRIVHEQHEDRPYEEVYIYNQELMKREGKEQPWTSTSLAEEDLDKSYDYNSFKGYRVISLNKLIEASNEDISRLDNFKIQKMSRKDGNKYTITFYAKGASLFLNSINDRVGGFENTRDTKCIIDLYVNGKNELVWEDGTYYFHDLASTVFYTIEYSNIGENIIVEGAEIK